VFFYNKVNMNRFFYFFFFLLKKKKLGGKKVQWKLSSFFYANRIKYFFYFLKKIFLYKKYFLYFFISNNVFSLFRNMHSYYASLPVSFFIVQEPSIFPVLANESIFSDTQKQPFIFSLNKMEVPFLFNSYFSMFLLKLFYYMYKELQMSYFSTPIRRNRYTILRSPHVDKKAREQFELKHFNVVISESIIYSFAVNTFLLSKFKFFISNFKVSEKNEYLIK
jgi:hypothetical protein